MRFVGGRRVTVRFGDCCCLGGEVTGVVVEAEVEGRQPYWITDGTFRFAEATLVLTHDRGFIVDVEKEEE